MTPPADWFIYSVILIVFLALVIALGTIARRLGAVQTNWSLANALSEETEVTVLDEHGTPSSSTTLPLRKCS
jgi:hypothetical protein